MTSATTEPFWIRTKDGFPMLDIPVRGSRAKPNLFLIGAAKTASTSLAQTLSEQPEISFSSLKEPHFFSASKHFDELGFDWYEGLFDPDENAAIRAEASTSYSNALYSSLTATRIKDYQPDALLVYIVREPVSRTESQLLQAYKYISNTSVEVKLPETADAFLDMLMVRRLELGLDPVANSQYMDVLDDWLKHFSPNQIKVVFFEDLVDRYQETVSDVLGFCGLGEREVPSRHANRTADGRGQVAHSHAYERLSAIPGASQVKHLLPSSLKNAFRNVTARRHPIHQFGLSDDRKFQLRKHFRPHNARLRNYLSRDLPW